jgi:hypothetical protein
MRAVEQKVNFSARLPFALLSHFLLPPIAQSRIVNEPSRGVALLTGGSVEVASAVKCPVECFRRVACHRLDPRLRIPWGARNLRLGRPGDGLQSIENFPQTAGLHLDRRAALAPRWAATAGSKVRLVLVSQRQAGRMHRGLTDERRRGSPFLLARLGRRTVEIL